MFHKPGDCVGLDDDEIDLNIPDTFWLWNPICKHILSVKVHLKNADVTTIPVAVPPGLTRNKQRQIQADKIHKEREAAAVEHDAVVAVRVSMKKSQERINNVMARESILSSQKKRESAIIKNAAKKLKALKYTKAVFVEKHGEERWKEEVDKCMMEMLGSKTPEDNMLDDAFNDQSNNESADMGGIVTASATNNESEDEDEEEDDD